MEEPLTGSELTGMTKQGNVSKHLGVLLNARFVARRREGNFARYALADKKLYQLCELMRMPRGRRRPAGQGVGPIDRSTMRNHMGTKRLVNRETSTITVGTGSCVGRDMSFSESQFEREKVIVRRHQAE